MSEFVTTSGSSASASYSIVSAAAGTGLVGYSAASTGAENYGAGTQANASLSGAATGNVAIGYQANWQVTSGSHNIAVGYNTIRNGTTTGSYNVGIGYFAGRSISTGSNNVAVGPSCGQNLTTGSANMLMGYQAGLNLTTWTGMVCIGNQAGTSFTVPGINEPAPSVAIGHLAMKWANVDGGNVAVGAYSMGGNGTQPALATGYRNVAVGRAALGLVSQGVHNTAVGDSALPAVTVGGSNTAVGRASGNSLLTSGFNSFFGHAAGFYVNPSATFAFTPLGGTAQTLQGDNVCMGNSAGGSLALNNTATQTTGLGNIALGTYAGPGAAAVNQSICIGLFANTSTSATTVIGQQQTAALISGSLASGATLSTLSTAGNQTLTATQLMGKYLTRSGNAVAVTDTTPTATQIVAAIPGCEAGSSYEVAIINANTAAGMITLAAGTGVTLAGTTTVAIASTRRYAVVVTNAASGSQAVTIQGLYTATS